MSNRHAYRRKSREVEPQKVVPVQGRYPAGKYRRVALVYILRSLCPLVFLALFLVGVFTESQNLKLMALIPLSLFIICTIAFWASANQVICRICRTPMLKHLKCSKKKGKIPHFLGDRSLATSISLLLRRPHITCQYCAERHKYFE